MLVKGENDRGNVYPMGEGGCLDILFVFLPA